MGKKHIVIYAIAINTLPSFVSNESLLSNLYKAGHRVVIFCPRGTGELVKNWREKYGVVAIEYDNLSSDLIRAFNEAINAHLDWKDYDILLTNDADCEITPSVIDDMQAGMYAFERYALGSPRMDIPGWFFLKQDEAPFALDNLPCITRVPFPTSSCVYLKSRQIKMFGLLDDSYDSLEYALWDYALRVNARGFDSVMLNHAFISIDSYSKQPIPHDSSNDWYRLIEEYEFVDHAIEQFKHTGIDPIDRFKDIICSNEKTTPSILLDYSNMPANHCGLTEYQVGLLSSLQRNFADKYEIHVFSNKEGAQFHNLKQYCEQIVYDESDLGVYDIGLYAFQPTEVFRQVIVDRHCARMIYTMLDTILLRCRYIDSMNVYGAIEAVRLGLENCDGIIAISDYSRRDYLDFFQDDPSILNKPSKRLYVASKFDASSSQVNAEALENLIPFNDYVLIAGNPLNHKALKEAVEALDNSGRNYVALGWKENGFIFPNVYGLRNGRLSDGELIELYRQCRAFIFPSVYEGFGLPIVNALSCGKTVIANQNELNHELKEHLGGFATNLLFFDLFDDLPDLVEEAISTPEHKGEYIDSWDVFTEGFCDFVDEIIAKPLNLDTLRQRHYTYAAHWGQMDGMLRSLEFLRKHSTIRRTILEELHRGIFGSHPRRLDMYRAWKEAIRHSGPTPD